jgi:hypothetical protein
MLGTSIANVYKITMYGGGIMKKTLALFVGLTGFLISGSASAASYTFNINTSLAGSSNGLDHHYAYAWNMSGFNLGSDTVTAASLTFTNFRNWDNNANQLFVYIGATSVSSPGSGGASACTLGACGTVGSDTTVGGIVNHTTYFSDNTSGTTISDAFSGTSATPLYNSSVGSLSVKNASSGHTYIASPSGFTTTSTPTLTINFTGAQLADLTTFIGSAMGGDFALLLDSDCHYFFDNAVFTMTTTSAVPEPGSVLLLLTVVAFVGLTVRSRDRKGAVLR